MTPWSNYKKAREILERARTLYKLRPDAQTNEALEEAQRLYEIARGHWIRGNDTKSEVNNAG